MKMPESQEEVVQELKRVEAEIQANAAKRKWLVGQMKALQELCSHPDWHHDNDPRCPSSHCKVCGFIQ